MKVIVITGEKGQCGRREDRDKHSVRGMEGRGDVEAQSRYLVTEKVRMTFF